MNTDTNNKSRYFFKFVNKKYFTMREIKYSLYLVSVFNSNVSYRLIMQGEIERIVRKRFLKNDKYNRNCVLISTSENINDLLKDTNNFISLELELITDISFITAPRRRFTVEYDFLSLKKGSFRFGSSMKISQQ